MKLNSRGQLYSQVFILVMTVISEVNSIVWLQRGRKHLLIWWFGDLHFYTSSLRGALSRVHLGDNHATNQPQNASSCFNTIIYSSTCDMIRQRKNTYAASNFLCYLKQMNGEILCHIRYFACFCISMHISSDSILSSYSIHFIFE